MLLFFLTGKSACHVIIWSIDPKSWKGAPHKTSKVPPFFPVLAFLFAIHVALFSLLYFLKNASNLVIFAITCQNNLFPGGAGGGGWVPPHWIVKQLRHSDSTAGSRTKDLTLQALEESCIQTEGPSFEKTLRGSQRWCQLVPVLAPYLEAVYRKPTLRTQKIRLLGQTQIHYTSLTDRRKAENIYRFRQVGVSRSTLLFTNMAERLATHWACITDKQKKSNKWVAW